MSAGEVPSARDASTYSSVWASGMATWRFTKTALKGLSAVSMKSNVWSASIHSTASGLSSRERLTDASWPRRSRHGSLTALTLTTSRRMHAGCANMQASSSTAPFHFFPQTTHTPATRLSAARSDRRATRQSVSRARLGTLALVVILQPAGACGPEHSARASAAPRLQSRCRRTQASRSPRRFSSTWRHEAPSKPSSGLSSGHAGAWLTVAAEPANMPTACAARPSGAGPDVGSAGSAGASGFLARLARGFFGARVVCGASSTSTSSSSDAARGSSIASSSSLSTATLGFSGCAAMRFDLLDILSLQAFRIGLCEAADSAFFRSVCYWAV
mmetsp:Transcript_5578/g.16430  ORF Transcript_5578/g.16430 Transcript_5578/m.16430 type:complete len:330 (+) Transcript_5578:546-1535(+)